MENKPTIREEWNKTYPAEILNDYGSVFTKDVLDWWLNKIKEVVEKKMWDESGKGDYLVSAKDLLKEFGIIK